MNKTYTDKPLTLRELNEDIEQRIEKITNEFTRGFDFIKNCTSTVTFFGSSMVDENHEDYKKCRSIAGRIVKEIKYAVITGGGPGIMEAANRGAYENGGESIGLTINLPREQVTNNFLTAHVGFDYFFSRKVCLTYSAEAFVYFPGGFGSFDELFEILTLVQTKKIHPVPIILVGKTFWSKFDDFVKEIMLTNNKIDPEDVNLYTIIDDEDEILNIIKNAPKRIA